MCHTKSTWCKDTRHDKMPNLGHKVTNSYRLTLNLLTTTIVAPPSNASKGQMGFNSVFKGLRKYCDKFVLTIEKVCDISNL